MDSTQDDLYTTNGGKTNVLATRLLLTNYGGDPMFDRFRDVYPIMELLHTYTWRTSVINAFSTVDVVITEEWTTILNYYES